MVSIYIPINVTDINKTAFSNSGLTTVELHCKEMGRAWFEDVTSIKNVIIGEEVTNIGPYTFKNCTGITSISIPGNVKSIDEAAFEDCSELSSLFIADGLVSIKPEALLLVEDASVNSYKYLSPWNGFGNIRGINDYTAIEGIQSKAIGSKNLFDLYGNRICQMKRGVNIIRQSDGKTKKVVFKR